VERAGGAFLFHRAKYPVDETVFRHHHHTELYMAGLG